jgi:hypothetical protein
MVVVHDVSPSVVVLLNTHNYTCATYICVHYSMSLCEVQYQEKRLCSYVFQLNCCFVLLFWCFALWPKNSENCKVVN